MPGAGESRQARNTGAAAQWNLVLNTCPIPWMSSLPLVPPQGRLKM
jgi:hypothetical protein